MIIEPLPFDFNKALEKFQRQRSKSRTPGVHLSSVIKYYMQIIEPKRFSGQADLATFQYGFLWEDVLSWAFGKQMSGASFQQDELDQDGIIMTPDALKFKKERVVETKATKMNKRNPLSSAKFWHWMVQIKGYCYAMRWLEAELKVFWINGSYELGGGRFGEATASSHLLIFSKRELIENWELVVLRTRDRMLKDRSWCERYGVAA